MTEAAMDTTARSVLVECELIEKDWAERQIDVLFALQLGRPCHEIARNDRERDLCRAMQPAIRQMRARGEGVDAGAGPR
jgi:hypothetical protein